MPESQRPERDRERVSKSQREPQLEGLLQKRGKPHIFSIPKHYFVAKQLNQTLFCRDIHVSVNGFRCISCKLL